MLFLINIHTQKSRKNKTISRRQTFLHSGLEIKKTDQRWRQLPGGPLFCTWTHTERFSWAQSGSHIIQHWRSWWVECWPCILSLYTWVTLHTVKYLCKKTVHRKALFHWSSGMLLIWKWAMSRELTGGWWILSQQLNVRSPRIPRLSTISLPGQKGEKISKK